MDSEKPNKGAKSPGDVRPHGKKPQETLSLEDTEKSAGLRRPIHFRNIWGHLWLQRRPNKASFPQENGYKGKLGRGKKFIYPSLDDVLPKHTLCNEGYVHFSAYNSEQFG